MSLSTHERAPLDPDALAATIAEQGYVIIPDVIEPAFCDALVEEIKRIEHDYAIAEGGNDFEGFHTRRIFNVLTKSPLFGDAAIHPRVLPVVEAVLKPGHAHDSIAAEMPRGAWSCSPPARGTAAVRTSPISVDTA